jgi:DNA-binding MarR family transcriptional regulator
MKRGFAKPSSTCKPDPSAARSAASLRNQTEPCQKRSLHPMRYILTPCMYIQGLLCIIFNYMGTHTSAADDVRRVLDSIRQIVQALRLSATDAQRSLSLSAAQLFVLHKLGGGEGISMNELARRTHTHQSSVSVVVQRLVEKRLVRRQRSAADGRQVELQLTAAGLRKLRVAPQAAQDALIESLMKMGRRNQRELARLLEEFAQGTGMVLGLPGMIFEERTQKRGRKSDG